MSGEVVTIESLAEDFGLSIDETLALARRCGVEDASLTEELGDDEIDRMYDTWLEEGLGHKTSRSGKREKMILIDTSSLLQEEAEQALKQIVSKLMSEGRKLIVPLVVIDELNRKAIQNQNPSLARRARNIVRLVLEYQELGGIAIYGDKNDGSFADNVFQKVAAMFALNYDITVITQDKFLSQDLLTMANMNSVRHRKISVFRIGSDGKLVKAVRSE